MNDSYLSKSYWSIFVIWIFTLFGALLLSFIFINYPNNYIFKFIICLLAGISAILTIFVMMKKLNIFSNILLILFTVVIFINFFCFDKRMDYFIYNIYFLITLIFMIVTLIIHLIKKNKSVIAHAIIPFVYSSGLMVIKMIELDRYITVIDDGYIVTFLFVGLISAVISIIIYLLFVRKNVSKKNI